MSRERLYVDLHVIQTVPPSCVNRDDTGSPKTAVYGGVTRARVSSQAWKHAMREYFKNIFTDDEVGIRSKKLIAELAAEIEKLDPGADGAKLAANVFKEAIGKIDEKKNELEALFFISRAQIRKLAEIALDKEIDKKNYKKECKKALKAAPGFDMALFGRMVATEPDLNYDACAQVAHSISTHAVQTEYDYFTAVDDLSAEDTAGAGHLGTTEFNSSTLYRYATVNAAELVKTAERDSAKAVRGFAEAFIRSMPTGKQNSFANLTIPDLVYITVRRDQPANFCGAFEEPVKSKDGYADKSADRFMEYAKKAYEIYVKEPELELKAGVDMSVDKLLDKLEEELGKYLA